MTQSEPGLIEFLQARQVDVVFDVGANEGQFGLSLRERGYRGQIVSFEPIHAAFEILQGRAAQDEGWQAHPVALGDAPGTAVINVAALSVFSSILSHRNAATAFDPRAAPTRTEEISVSTLDQFAPAFAGRSCFLKVDTQGYERQVLLGAKETLAQLQGVQMELPLVHLYSEVWGLGEAIRFMADRGFVVAQMHPVNFHHADPVSWVEADCVFRRTDPTID